MHLDQIPNLPRIAKPAAERAGVRSGDSIPTEVLVDSVLVGEALHDSLRDLAARHWTEDQLRELMGRSDAKAARPDIWQERLDEIPRLVRTAARLHSEAAAKVFATPAVVPPNWPKAAEPARLVALTPFEAAAIPRRSWLVPGILLDGAVTVLVASGGVGKSALALRLALAVAAGSAWGPWKPTERRKVLVCNAEDDADELRRRIAVNFDEVSAADVRDMIVTLDTPNLVLMERTGEARGAGKIVRTPLFEQLRRLAREVGFIVLDPLVQLSGGLNENENADMDALVGGIREIAREAHIPILLVHHAKKGGDGGAEASRGASAIINAARIAMTLGPLSQSELKGVLASDPDASFCKAAVVKSNYSARGGARVLEFQSVDVGNGDRAARLVHVEARLASDDEPIPFNEWPALLELVQKGQPNGQPWLASEHGMKERRLDAEIVSRWRLPISAAVALLKQGEAEGLLARAVLPTKNKPKIWTVGPAGEALLRLSNTTAE